MLQRYFAGGSEPEITALGKLAEDLKRWSDDTPLDYTVSGDKRHLTFLQSRNDVRILHALGEPFGSVMRDLEMLEKRRIDDLIAELRTGRDEMLAFTRRGRPASETPNRISSETDPKQATDANEAGAAGRQANGRTGGQIGAGVTWQEAQQEAKRIVKEQGWPGKTKLLDVIKCHHKTLDKAIERSELLKKAEEEAPVSSPHTVGLSEKHEDTTPTTADDPQMEAAVGERATDSRADLINRA